MPPYAPPAGKQVVSPQAAFIVTDILAGNTNPSVNPFWGKFAITGPGGRRPATLKTGTNNDAKDLNAYGYIAPPTDAGRDGRRLRPRRRRLERQLRQQPGLDRPGAALLDRRLDLRLAGLPPRGQREVAGDQLQAAGRRARPGQDRPVDRVSRPRPDKSGRRVVHRRHRAQGHDRPRTRAASTSSLKVNVETRLRQLDAAPTATGSAAPDGPGVVGGPDRTRTAYFYNGAFHPYGSLVGRPGRRQSCGQPSPSPSCFVVPTPDPSGVMPSFAIPTPVGSRPGRGPLPAREPDGVAVGRAIARTVRATEPSRHRPSHRRRRRPSRRRPRSRSRRRPRTSRQRHAPSAATGPRPASDRRRPAVVAVRGLTVRRAGRTILGPLDWTIRDGERWVVLGPNGSGKTTLLSVRRARAVADGRHGRRSSGALRRASIRASSAGGSASAGQRGRGRRCVPT